LVRPLGVGYRDFVLLTEKTIENPARPIIGFSGVGSRVDPVS
jgi:hypothetical protein